MKKEIGTLYKITSTGATQIWHCWVEHYAKHSTIFIEYGQQDGKMQTTSEIISEGKNIGKKNETSIREQTEAEAKSQKQKKIDKGYVENIKDISTGGKNSDIRPMLAHSYEDRKHNLEGQNVFYQPKLDGIRCIAKAENGIITLWSRGGKQITSLPNIAGNLSVVMVDGEIWDGELYSPNLEFNDITHIVRQEAELPDGFDKIRYYIYDIFGDKPFRDRLKVINGAVCSIPFVSKVETVGSFPFDEKQMIEFHDQFTDDGFEGVMIRLDNDKPYEQKRSNNLLKYKHFQDAEFKVIGFEHGKPGTKLDGCISALELEIIINGKREVFKSKPEGSIELLAHIKNNPEEYLNKMVKVKFQNYSKYGIPRFPIVQGLRWSADI